MTAKTNSAWLTVGVLGPLTVILPSCSADQTPAQSAPAASRPATGTAASTAPTTTTGWRPPRFDDRRDERYRMVREDIAASPDGRQPVQDKRVLDAMRAVPRHLFVPQSLQSQAYADYPLPIGHGQTISQPYIVALTTEAVRVSPGDKVLEIGTGSAYQAAVLAELTPDVHTIEIVKPLADPAAERLKRLGYTTVRVRCGDGYEGWPEAAPFDGIIVTCSAENLPPALWEQLKVGGRIVIPIGEEMRVQQLTVLTKMPDGTRRREVLTPCAFVPMTGKIRSR